MSKPRSNVGWGCAKEIKVGSPFGVIIEFVTCGEKGPELQDTVTLSDSGEQDRVKISELLGKLLPLVS
jgi:glycyl-tRNA synthetase